MTMTRRGLAKGAAAALVAAPVLLPAVSEAATTVTRPLAVPCGGRVLLCSTPHPWPTEGLYSAVQTPIRANYVSVNGRGEMTLVYTLESVRLEGETDAQLRARMRGAS